MKNIFLLFVILLIGCLEYPLEELSDESLRGNFISNPNTPLSGIYRLDMKANNPITILIKGKTPDMDISYTGVFDTRDIPIHGLYANYPNTVIIKGRQKAITNIVRTSVINFVNAKVIVDCLPDPDPKNQDFYFVSHLIKKSTQQYVLIAYDRYGDIRYLNNTDKLHYLRHQDRQILIYNNKGIFDLLGNSIVNYRAKTNFHIHHDSLEIGNNKFAVLVESQWGVEDRVVEIDRQGNLLKDRSFGALFRDIIRDPDEIKIMNKIIYDEQNTYIKDGQRERIDWAHVNSLVYDSKKDIMYFSLRNQGVIAVNYKEWKLLWWMVDDTLDTIHIGVPNRGMNFLDLPSLAPYRVMGDGATDGPKNQHALLLLENGNLAMFDNQGDEANNNAGSR
ncbi:MAG: aryl-sulfate sulfotransferase, partial [Brevinema sp.]